MNEELAKSVMAVMIRFSCEFASRPTGDLQPYEALVYKQMCDMMRKWGRLYELTLDKAIEEVNPPPTYTDEDGQDGPTTVSS